ncbi:MAG TPA: S41 family peptidase [Mucilaginibacter sp.]|nr:S41 family peptidase [Mucilaginibacter sp.]
MKITIGILIFYGITAFYYPDSAKAQQNLSSADSARRLVDTALQFAKTRSLYRMQVNWPEVEDSVRQVAGTAKNIRETMPAIRLLFSLLKDHHGFITYGKTIYRWDKRSLPLDKAVHKNLINKYKAGFKLMPQVLDKHYGYLLLPGNNPTHSGDIERLARQIRDSLTLFSRRSIKGLIIDLRLNTGGSMWPMIGGLSALFKPGKLGAFTYADAQSEEAWGIYNSKVYDGADTVCAIKSRGKDLSDMKVVILLSPYTASSAEALAISFKGRPNTRFIGEPSAGYTTANESVQFTPDIGLFLATAVESDRNGKSYPDRVTPDEEIVGGDDFDHLLNDQKVTAALKWLKSRQ